MSRVEAATGMDRLPWLQDEPAAAPARRRSASAIGSAAAAVLLVGGAAFWFGARSADEQPAPSSKRAAPAATVRLPDAQAAPEVRMTPQPEIIPAPAPEVRPAPAPQVRLAPPPQRSAQRETVKTAPPPEEPAAATATAVERPTSKAPIAVARPQPVPLRPWQPRVVAGAAGRLVEVGAFGSVQQAKLGWRYMVRAYPAMTRLPAVVRPDRNSKGRVFYRFRVGTTSQAHSEVLCQRMQRILLSCAVVDLPWKAKVER
jgi:outer membrane biosynthesis protein TonB